MKLKSNRQSGKPAGNPLTLPISALARPDKMAAEVFPQRLMLLVLVLITVIAYLPAFHAGFIWDDDAYVTNNPLLTAPDGLRRIWFSLDSPSQYFPLTYTVFRIQRALWGLMPAGYHCFNILLHSLNAVLVWRLLRRLRVPGAWLAAAIFALHPVQVESVAWITELKNMLSLFFILLTLLAWVEFIEEKRIPAWHWYVAALVCYALALAGKSTACTLPAALLLILWLKHEPLHWRRLAQIIPFLALGAGMGLLAMWWERYHQGTEGKLFALSFPERILVASHAFWFYLGKLVWPVRLTFSYPHWAINPSNPLAYGWLVAGLGLAVLICFLRRWAGRGPEVAMLFYVLTMAPLMGFIMLFTFLYTYVADHYQYVACIGPIALAAAGINGAFDVWGKQKAILKPLFCGVLLSTLGILTWRQCGMYTNQEVLWRTTLQRNPASWMAYVNLGEYLASEGREDEAVVQWNEALKLKPDDAFAYYDLGVASSHAGRLPDAVAKYEKALQFEPDLVKPCNKLAWIYATSPEPALRNGARAVELAEHANQISRGTDPAVLSTLAAAYAAVGRFSEAVTTIRDAFQIPAAQNNAVLTNDLQVQLRLYQANSTFRDLSLTNVSLQ